jgi:hypothetical protein
MLHHKKFKISTEHMLTFLSHVETEQICCSTHPSLLQRFVPDLYRSRLSVAVVLYRAETEEVRLDARVIWY